MQIRYLDFNSTKAAFHAPHIYGACPSAARYCLAFSSKGFPCLVCFNKDAAPPPPTFHRLSKSTKQYWRLLLCCLIHTRALRLARSVAWAIFVAPGFTRGMSSLPPPVIQSRFPAKFSPWQRFPTTTFLFIQYTAFGCVPGSTHLRWIGKWERLGDKSDCAGIVVGVFYVILFNYLMLHKTIDISQ